MTITTFTVRTALIFVSVLSLFGCACHQKNEDDLAQPPAFELDDIAVPGEFLIQLDDSVSLATLQSAWAVFNPQLEWVGPESHRLLKMVVSADYDTALVKENIAATKGVVAVQLNYRRNTINTLDALEQLGPSGN